MVLSRYLQVAALAAMLVSFPALALDVAVPIDARTTNPCTGELVNISGKATLSGDLRDVSGGQRFVGDVSYEQLMAKTVSGDTTYEATGMGVGRKTIREKVSVPVDEKFTTVVKFMGPKEGDNFIAHITTHVTYGLFTGKSTEVTDIDTECARRSS